MIYRLLLLKFNCMQNKYIPKKYLYSLLVYNNLHFDIAFVFIQICVRMRSVNNTFKKCYFNILSSCIFLKP